MHSLFSSMAICRWHPSLRRKSTFPHRHCTIHLLHNVAVPRVVNIPSCVSFCGCYASERLRKETSNAAKQQKNPQGTPNTRKHQKPPKRNATKERNRGSEVAGDGYGHVAARWWATGMGTTQRGGGRRVRRVAARWRAASILDAWRLCPWIQFFAQIMTKPENTCP